MTEMLLRFPNIQTGCSQSTAYPCSSHTKHLQQLLRPELACRRWRQHHAAGPAIAAPTPRLVAVASSSDWSPAQPSASSYDWHVSSGAGSYADPRLAPGYRPAQPASYPSPHQTGGQQHAEAGPFQDGPSSSFDASQDGYDPLADFVRNASEAVGSFLGYVVGRVSDLVLSMLPATARRRAVENSVKGALALLGLALLQSVLSLVLTVGSLVLAVYAAYAVFGVHLPTFWRQGAAQPGPADSGMPRASSAVPPMGPADPRYGAPGPGYGTPGPGYGSGYGGGYSGGYGGYGAPPYGQPPPPGYYSGGGGYGGYPLPHPSQQQQRYFGGRGAGRGRWQGQGLGPTIDVYYDNAESGSGAGAGAGAGSGQGSGSGPVAA